MPDILNFFVFNIKLQSSKTGDDRTNAYIALIEKMTEKKSKPFETSKNEAIVFYESSRTKSSNSTLYLYGRAAKGLYISGNERQILNNGEVNKESNNPNQLINPLICRYLFVPKTHRLFLERKLNGPTQFDVEKYLLNTLNNFIDGDELLEIVLEKDDSTIREIFEAEVVHSLSYTVSYSNEDFLSDLADDYDKELKENNIGEISVTAKADNNAEGLKIGSSRMLGGGLKLAETNGEIKSASITPKGKRKKKTVTNRNKPKVLHLKIEEKDNFWEKWYKNVLSIYRPNN